MSVSGSGVRRILDNITNMEEHHPGKTNASEPRDDVDGVADGAPAKAEPTLDGAASDPTDAPPSGLRMPKIKRNILKRILNNRSDQKYMVRLREACLLESGSGSGEQDGMQTEDVLDGVAKKRKTRRGKPKHRKLKPYSKQAPYSKQPRQHVRASNRSTGSKSATGRHTPPAPYNTNQFLIEDHNDLPDLEHRLACEMSAPFQKPQPPPRTRDSSFSIDSEEEPFYSSPEDEEAFLTKEFSSAYEDVHAERLGSLSKSELIQEYIQLEAKVDLLTKRLKGRSLHQNDDREATIKGDPDSATKLKLFQQRIDDLVQQNDKLKRENEKLRAMKETDSEVDSDSDSDSSWTSLHLNQDYPLSNSSSSSSPGPISYQRKINYRNKDVESNGDAGAASRQRRHSLNDGDLSFQ